MNARKTSRQSNSVSPRNRQRRKAWTAYGLLLLIGVLLTVMLAVFPREGTPERADGEAYRQPPAEGAGEETKAPYRQAPGADEEPPVREPADERDEPSEKPSDVPAEKEEAAPALYLVIDDVGYDRNLLQPFLALPIPITFAVLPHLPDSRASARLIDRKGQEYILHQPMEAVGGDDPGPGAISSKMESKRIRKVVNDNLKELPKAKGVNNHMGSKGTAESSVMNPLLKELKQQRLFFLDSRTTAESVGYERAREAGVPFSARNVFLDNEDTKEYIDRALEESWEIARHRGEAVMIGHIWSDALPTALKEWIPRVREQGGEFRYLSSGFTRQ